mmetsp:Transcript_31246/g.99925  ORF Transcript_31246/g.99925 Transcript_31246/m.99925 type:complete len:268 (-) Transcript_31246:520-1323(-)
MREAAAGGLASRARPGVWLRCRGAHRCRSEQARRRRHCVRRLRPQPAWRGFRAWRCPALAPWRLCRLHAHRRCLRPRRRRRRPPTTSLGADRVPDALRGSRGRLAQQRQFAAAGGHRERRIPRAASTVARGGEGDRAGRDAAALVQRGRRRGSHVGGCARRGVRVAAGRRLSASPLRESRRSPLAPLAPLERGGRPAGRRGRVADRRERVGARRGGKVGRCRAGSGAASLVRDRAGARRGPGSASQDAACEARRRHGAHMAMLDAVG